MASIGSLFISSTSLNFYPTSKISSFCHNNRVFYKNYKINCTFSSAVDFSNSSADLDKSASNCKSGKWQWRFQDNPINIYYEEHEGEDTTNAKSILMIPTISDVSTVEEWRVVAKDIVTRSGGVNWRATIVDWPGLGYSDRPTLEYNADVMENFLINFMNSPDSPLSNSSGELVIIGGGHAATIALRAAGKGQVKPSAIAAVAPTWSGPLPIVFGRGSDMESRSIEPIPTY